MTLVIDAQVAGIAGDMMLAALVDLGADQEAITNGIRTAADLFDDVSIGEVGFARGSRCGTDSVVFSLKMDSDSGALSGAEVMRRVTAASDAIGLAREASGFAGASVKALVDAEARVHGSDPGVVILHEAAGFDTIADIVGSAMALQDLGLLGEHTVCTPVAVGSGTVSFSHGISSNPVGGVLEIFRGSGMLVSGNDTRTEMTTPTGACMLAGLAAIPVRYYPVMSIDAIGYGAGARELDGLSNVLKLVRGTVSDGYSSDMVAVLETNIDDISGEVLGEVIERMMEGGARDVTVSPAVGKKGRPAHVITVICDRGISDMMTRMLIAETGTLGVRIRTERRVTVIRSSHSMDLSVEGRRFTVRYKKSGTGDAYKIEADDISAVSGSIGRSFSSTERLIRHEIDRRDNT